MKQNRIVDARDWFTVARELLPRVHPSLESSRQGVLQVPEYDVIGVYWRQPVSMPEHHVRDQLSLELVRHGVSQHGSAIGNEDHGSRVYIMLVGDEMMKEWLQGLVGRVIDRELTLFEGNMP